MAHLFLTGYRGSGKSTIGQLLASHWRVPFADTDLLVEENAGCSIQEIFAREGESGFRVREEAALRNAVQATPSAVIALGGGAVLRETNRQLIRERGACVWLQGSPQALYARISGDPASQARRPDLSDRGGLDEVVDMLAQREPIYRDLSNFTVLTEDRTPDEIVTEIVDWKDSAGCQPE